MNKNAILSGIIAIQNLIEEEINMNVEEINMMEEEMMYVQTFEDDYDLNDDEVEEEEILAYIGRKMCPRSTIRISNYIDSIVQFYDEREFQQYFRMNRKTFDFLLTEINAQSDERNVVVGRPLTDLKKQLLSVIWLLATQHSYRSVAERFDISKGTLSRCFIRILNLINNLAPKFITWPSGENIKRVKNDFNSISGFDNLIGIIDGTYIEMKSPKDQLSSYTNKKGFTSMTLQATCDSNLMFIDCYAGWPSSVPNIRIFKNSELFQRVKQNPLSYFPNDEYIFGDKAYPVLNWCIPPFIINGNKTALTATEQKFNRGHASIRQIINRCFGLLFGRFPRLRYLDINRTDWIPATILACCVLHNICIIGNDDNIEAYIKEGEETRRKNFISHTFKPKQHTISQKAGNLRRTTLCQQICGK